MKTPKAPGRNYRTGLTVTQLLRQFSDNATAERWFEQQRWPDGIRQCPDCRSTNCRVMASRSPMPYRCRDCRGYFSVRKGTAMQGSKIGFQQWAIAFYLMATGIKGTSSMKLHRDLGIRQATAWFMLQRIREGFMGQIAPFAGPVEADETAVGAKRRNMPKARRRNLTGRGSIGKSIIAGVKDRTTRQVSAAVIERVDAATLQGFVRDRTLPHAMVYTDESSAYVGLDRPHATVCHGADEYVRGEASTNSIEAFWSLFKRGYHGTFHSLSAKHLNRYVQEFAGRGNFRDLDTIDQMAFLARGLIGRRLRYADLVG